MTGAIGRRVALFALIGAALATSPGAASAAPATHYSSSGMGAMAELEQLDGNIATVWGIFVDLVDPTTGDAQLNYFSEVGQLDEYGNYVPLSSATSFSTVHLDIDTRLTSARATGTILIDICQMSPDWSCTSTTQTEAYLDVVWTSASKQIKTHRIDLASVTHTSRVIMNSNSSFRLADAVATLDGSPLGPMGDPTETRIFDSSQSSVEIYHGTSGLPGVQMATSPVAESSGADPAAKPIPGANVDSEYIQASWSEPEQLFFYAGSMSDTPGQGHRVVDAYLQGALAGVDEWGNPTPTRYIEATGSGTFQIDNRLDGASFQGTLQGRVCLSDWGWWVCLDGVDIPVDVAFSGVGPTNSGIDTEIATGIDGTKYQTHLKYDTRNATVSGTIDGQELSSVPDNAWMELYTQRGWPYIP